MSSGDLGMSTEMGIQASSSSSASVACVPLSRKRPNAAGLPAIGLIGSMQSVAKRRADRAYSADLPKEDATRERHESEASTSSQSSSTSSSPSDDILPPLRCEQQLQQPARLAIELSSASTPATAAAAASAASGGGAASSAAPTSTDPKPEVATRACVADSFQDRAVVIEKEPACARLFFVPEKDLGPHLENDQIINGYRVIGMGKDANALHMQTGELVNVRLITKKEFETTQQVARQLEKAHEMCASWNWDVDELCEAVMPSSTEVVKERLPSGVFRYILFTPFEHSNLHVMASMASKSGPFGLPEENVAAYFKQLAAIIAFCHQLGIVVRDLKPRKLVFTNESKTKLRLSDVFDVAVCEAIEDDIVTEKFGSPAYIPPEVLNVRSNGFAGRPADIWGLGVLTFLLLTGKYPFYDNNPRGVFKRIRRALVCFPSGMQLSRAARDLVHGMLRKRPEERPSAALLSTVPWTTVKEANGMFRERVNHMISPQVGNSTTMRRRGVQIPPSDVLAEHVVPETTVRVAPDGGASRRPFSSFSAVLSSGDRAVPTAHSLLRFPVNDWLFSSEMETRLIAESRLPLGRASTSR